MWQVDDYLTSESSEPASSLKEFLHDQFQIVSMQLTFFTTMGAYLMQGVTGKITISRKKKVNHTISLETCLPHKYKDRIATAKKNTNRRSIVRWLLYVERLVNTIVAFHASYAAIKFSNLFLLHRRPLNATLQTIKNFLCFIPYLPPPNQLLELESKSDALMQFKNKKQRLGKVS